MSDNRTHSVTSCLINSDGSLSNCGSSAFTGSPNSIAVADGYAYILFNDSSTIKICNIWPDGRLGTCTSVQGFSGQNSIYISGTTAYLTGNQQVCACQISSGQIGTCNPSAPILGTYGNPNTIVVGNNCYAYIDDFSANSVYSCSLQPSGNIGTCSSTGSGFNNPNGVIAIRGAK